ncbi:hypothetical protein JOM56_005360 [Amanita muscaria]
MVRPLSFAANSFRDLDFLIPLGDNERHRVPKFLVFFDDTKEAERTTRYLQYRLPGPLRQKIRWFHSTMTPEYRADELEAFQLNKRWGLCTTDAFGMVSTIYTSYFCCKGTNSDIICFYRVLCTAQERKYTL